MNDNDIFEDHVFCNYLDERTISIDPALLEHSNQVMFSIDKGDYTLDNTRVVLELGKSVFPSYVFEVSNELAQRIRDGSAKVVLKLTMTGSERKKATILVQEESFSMDTTAESYTKDITAFIDNGANVLTIQPKDALEIVSLKVVEE